MFIRPITDAMFGTPDQTMNYKKYREVIQAGMGIQLVGWA
jgi:hypothetical protein